MDGCPWCGAPADDMMDEAGTKNFDLALEAHVEECEAAQAEIGGDQS
jgi:hypothetical protein